MIARLLPLLLLVPACAQAPAAPPATARPAQPAAVAAVAVDAQAWQHELSDVPVNPRIRFGALDNGLRWAWLANTEPRERCYVRLHVNVGSLGEQEEEQGLAHFLEHMAFNGSENFAAGTLIEWFQDHGMSFGADTNASTDFSETIYKLDLPKSDEATLREGLTFMRDVAGGLLLDAAEVDAEKGVIDGEERERDSAEFRAGIADLKDGFAGTRVAARIPIGLKSVRDDFTAEGVRAFWESWYRPDNMVLVVVGDLGALDPAPLVTEFFSDLQPPDEPLPQEPPLGTPPARDSAFTFHAPELPVESLTVSRWTPWEEEPQTRAEMVEDVALQTARRMLNLRFRELAKKADAPFLQARVGRGGGLRVADGEDLSVSCKPEDWKRALARAEQELRRALEHGFRPQELDEVRKDQLRAFDEAVEREATRGSESFADEILAAVEEPVVPTTAATDRDIMAPAIRALTPEACRDALRAAWGEGHLRLSAVGPLDLGADGPAELASAWAESGKVAVAAPEALSDLDFAYASRPEDAGTIATRLAVEDLGVTQVVFANGVRLNIKPTDFRKQQVLMVARVGQGRLTLEPSRAAVAFVASQVFDLAGLGKHSADDLRRLLAGRQANVSFDVSEDAFEFRGSTTPQDLLLQLELLAAYVRDPGWRPEALDQVRRNLPPVYEQLAHRPDGPLQLGFLIRMHGGDPRFGLPSLESALAVEMPEMRAWLDPLLASAPIELTVVGEVDVDAVIQSAARTFGALPARAAPLDVASRLSVKAATGLHENAEVETEVPQALVFIALPATDGRDAALRRQVNLLGNIVSDRLRIEVREKLGDAYAPGAQSNLSPVFPGLGFMLMNAVSEPAKAEDVLAACLGVADALAKDGVTAEELERQRGPVLTSLHEQVRRNEFWITALDDSQARPVALDEVRRLESDYTAITPEVLTGLAKKYLPSERANWIIVKPKAVAAESP